MTACFDAHNHLYDPEFAPAIDEVVSAMREAGIERCVVNGTCEEDWPAVADLALRFPGFVQPSFGLHPWKAAFRSPSWLARLTQHLSAFPNACIGECGLDRAMRDHDLDDQLAVFASQFDLAARHDLPVSIHCLKAWGPLLSHLRTHPVPHRGFLLHSYGGSRELVQELAPLGARFSFSGASLARDKTLLRETLHRIPIRRILVETDAPNMLPPPAHRRFTFDLPDNRELNHPANLPSIVDALGSTLDLAPEEFREVLARNFAEFFASPEGN